MIFGKFLSVIVIECILKGKNRLPNKEIFYISFAGMIKGALPFALALKYNKSD